MACCKGGTKSLCVWTTCLFTSQLYTPRYTHPSFANEFIRLDSSSHKCMAWAAVASGLYLLSKRSREFSLAMH